MSQGRGRSGAGSGNRWAPIVALGVLLATGITRADPVTDEEGASGRSSSAESLSSRDDVDTLSCADAMVEGQRLRAKRSLRNARRAFGRCAGQDCLRVVRRRCTEWLREVSEETPRLVVEVGGVPPEKLSLARLTIDGEQRPKALDQPVAMDPGHRSVELKLPDGRRAVREIEMPDEPGVYPLQLSFPNEPRQPEAVSAGPTVVEPSERAAPAETGVSGGTLTGGVGFALGGLAAAASISTGVIAHDRARELATQCETSGCSQEEIDDGRRIADASTATLVVSVVGVTVGIVGMLLMPDEASSPVAWDRTHLLVRF